MTNIDGFRPSSPPPGRRHRIAILAFDDVVVGDLAIPLEHFGQPLSPLAAHYETVVCSPTPEVRSTHLSLRVERRLRSLSSADTVIVPGSTDVMGPPPTAVVRALTRAYERGARIASICTGSFFLAAAGLLDGKRATTHWAAADLLAERFPAVDVDPDVLYVDDGQILTSAGAAAGHDLCLHMIRRDLGASMAAEVARIGIVPVERSGGQSQFVSYKVPSPDTETLGDLLAWLDENLEVELSVDALAARAGMSPRSLTRHFREQVGLPPAQWVAQARVRRAQRLLETTSLSVEEVAERSGFGSAVTLRQRFSAVVGTSPRAWRHTFGGASGING